MATVPASRVAALAACSVLAVGCMTIAAAQGAPPPQLADAAASDPVALGWMVGSPPPADKLIRMADMGHFQFPKTRWAFANMRQLAPSTAVWRGDGPPSDLPHAERDDLDGVSFTPLGGAAPMNWAQSVKTSKLIRMNHGWRIFCVLQARCNLPPPWSR